MFPSKITEVLRFTHPIKEQSYWKKIRMWLGFLLSTTSLCSKLIGRTLCLLLWMIMERKQNKEIWHHYAPNLWVFHSIHWSQVNFVTTFCHHTSAWSMVGSTLFCFGALIRDIVHCYVFWINNLCATGNMSQTSEWPMRTKTAVRPKLLSLRT